MKSRRSVTLTLLGALLLLAVATQAQDTGPDSLTYQPKSENTALMLSLSGTVIPVALGVAEGVESNWLITGIFLGPSLGYFYGEEVGRGLKGIAIRTCVGTASYRLALLAASPDTHAEGWPILLAGAVVVTVDAIYDMAKVKGAVRKHNEKLQARSLGIIPTYSPDWDAAGLALQLTF